MQLTQEEIEEFKTIYKKEFGQELTNTQAQEMGTRLVRMFEVVLEPKVSPWHGKAGLQPENLAQK